MKEMKELLKEPRMSINTESSGNRLFRIFEMINEFYKEDFTVIEIGSFEGASTEMFAISCKKVYSIDPYDMVDDSFELQITKDNLKKAEQVFIERFKDYKNVIKIRDFSENVTDMFEDESIDAIYIDGNHNFYPTINDIINYFPKIKKDGIISGHDYYWHPIKKAIKHSIDNVIKYYDDESWVAIKDEKTINIFNRNKKNKW